MRRPLFRLAAALAMVLPSAACNGPRLLDALIPSDGYRIERGLAYGTHARQRLDVYVPATREGPAPVVVFLYGGGWESGERGIYRFVGQALTSRGFVAVVPDYRLHPEVAFPAFVEDAAEAVAWVQARIARFGGDPGRIHLVGHSAGAHIAALLALDPRYLAAAGPSREAITRFVGLAGPYDFLPLESDTLKAVFDVPDRAVTQPITFADGTAPPALLLHGENDRTVLPANSERLARRLEEEGAVATHRAYANLGHIGIVLALARPFRWLAPVLDDVTGFLEPAPPG